jgi:hypothetical protein
MPGLVPGIHVFAASDVDGKAGHDELKRLNLLRAFSAGLSG